MRKEESTSNHFNLRRTGLPGWKPRLAYTYSFSPAKLFIFSIHTIVYLWRDLAGRRELDGCVEPRVWIVAEEIFWTVHNLNQRPHPYINILICTDTYTCREILRREQADSVCPLKKCYSRTCELNAHWHGILFPCLMEDWTSARSNCSISDGLLLLMTSMAPSKCCSMGKKKISSSF